MTEVTEGGAHHAALRIDHLGGDAISPAGWSIRFRTPGGEIVYPLPERIGRTPWEFVKGETLFVLYGFGADMYLAEPHRRLTYWLYAGADPTTFPGNAAVDAELLDPEGSVRATTRSQDP